MLIYKINFVCNDTILFHEIAKKKKKKNQAFLIYN